MLARLWDKQRAQAILATLDEDRKLLMKGDLRGLSSRTQRLESLTLQIERLAENPDTTLLPLLEKVRAAADRNGRLIRAVNAGIASAEARLQRLAQANGPLRTYNGSGQQVVMSSGRSESDRRI